VQVFSRSFRQPGVSTFLATVVVFVSTSIDMSANASNGSIRSNGSLASTIVVPAEVLSLSVSTTSLYELPLDHIAEQWMITESQARQRLRIFLPLHSTDASLGGIELPIGNRLGELSGRLAPLAYLLGPDDVDRLEQSGVIDILPEFATRTSNYSSTITYWLTLGPDVSAPFTWSRVEPLENRGAITRGTFEVSKLEGTHIRSRPLRTSDKLYMLNDPRESEFREAINGCPERVTTSIHVSIRVAGDAAYSADQEQLRISLRDKDTGVSSSPVEFVVKSGLIEIMNSDHELPAGATNLEIEILPASVVGPLGAVLESLSLSFEAVPQATRSEFLYKAFDHEAGKLIAIPSPAGSEPICLDLSEPLFPRELCRFHSDIPQTLLLQVPDLGTDQTSTLGFVDPLSIPLAEVKALDLARSCANLLSIAESRNIILAAPDLVSAAHGLDDGLGLQYRRALARLTDVANVFGGSLPTPWAIKSFLTWLSTLGRLDSLLILGDGSSDPRVVSNEKQSSEIPVWLMLDPIHRDLRPSDFWYEAKMTGTEFPDGTFAKHPWAVGRWPASNESDVERLVELWSQHRQRIGARSVSSVVFVADDAYSSSGAAGGFSNCYSENADEQAFESTVIALGSTLADEHAPQTASLLLLDEFTSSARAGIECEDRAAIQREVRRVATPELMRLVTSGIDFLGYYGHGNRTTLSEELLFSHQSVGYRDIDRLSAVPHPFVICLLGCASADFGIRGKGEVGGSLAELFLLKDGTPRGLAVISSTGSQELAVLGAHGESLMKNLVTGSEFCPSETLPNSTIGARLSAWRESVLPSATAAEKEMLAMMTLLGDPMLPVVGPHEGILLRTDAGRLLRHEERLPRLESAQLSGSLEFSGCSSSCSWQTSSSSAIGKIAHSKYVDRDLATTDILLDLDPFQEVVRIGATCQRADHLEEKQIVLFTAAELGLVVGGVRAELGSPIAIGSEPVQISLHFSLTYAVDPSRLTWRLIGLTTPVGLILELDASGRFELTGLIQHDGASAAPALALIADGTTHEIGFTATCRESTASSAQIDVAVESIPGGVQFYFAASAPISNIALAIFDVRGRQVCRVTKAVDRVSQACLSWTGTDGRGSFAANGVYYYVSEIALERGRVHREVGKALLLD